MTPLNLVVHPPRMLRVATLLTIKDPIEVKPKLTPADADALGFLKDTSPQLANLRAWKKKVGDGETKALRPIAAIQRVGYRRVFLRYDSEGRWPRVLLSPRNAS